jgi:predicted metalloprotease with PDZ domain
VRPSYFHFIGDAALVIPEIDGLSPVTVATRRMPRGWRFASDLQHPTVLARANASISVGGDFRIVRASGEPDIRIAIRGAWPFSDADFAAEAARIVAGQRRFWNDAPAPFLVTVIQLTAANPGSIAVGGTGLGDAFAFFATANGQPRLITRTLAHETQHTWIPGEIGGMPAEGEAASYWFSEGFTDFYTSRLLVRDGVWTPADFAAEFNQMLGEYARSPVRGAPNRRILADYWNDADVQRLPYQRGQMLAWIWDRRMRGRGPHDLDDVVLEMRARARGGDPLKAAAMFAIVAQSLGLDVREDLEAHVEAGQPIVLPEDLFGPCGRIVTRLAPNFDRGFDVAATQAHNGVIAGVDPASPAYAAGMRDGMVLVRREAGEIGNAELEIAYLVREGEAERIIRYMPRGAQT